MKNSGIPARFYEDVLKEAQAMTLDSLTHVTMESILYRLPAGLERVHLPVLVVAGQREYKVIRESARDLVAASPGAEGRLVRNGIHAWNMQFPDLFVETVRAWIDGRPLPSELVPL